MGDPKGYYATLEVAPTATQADIKKARDALLQRCHADKQQQHGQPAHAATSTKESQAINEAYRVVGNEGRRWMYDNNYLYGAMGYEGPDSTASSKAPPEQDFFDKFFDRPLFGPGAPEYPKWYFVEEAARLGVTEQGWYTNTKTGQGEWWRRHGPGYRVTLEGPDCQERWEIYKDGVADALRFCRGLAREAARRMFPCCCKAKRDWFPPPCN
ncbi:unnamed protein product [Vitrella brassicaformis CCMP3155]|uniref:J domain-containing protein n=1 Tax=Vitrella brassicaformis (strain CCMP3155) TaxID=1169540 RepID=A0A0G4EG60_VITBC|nr:unnamed protein product [Vitrella brassicaformis CCMP3155]|eukprot:CEL95506.1 unnamed protein product [Vitrella brassicaformis CCMP3155]